MHMPMNSGPAPTVVNRNQDYLTDLRHDLQDDEYAFLYLSACAMEGGDTLRLGLRDVKEAWLASHPLQDKPPAASVTVCPKCGGRLNTSGGHGEWCPKATCKWGWEVEADGSPLQPPLPAAPGAVLADAILRRIAMRYKNCKVHIFPDLPELTPVEAVLRCAQEEGFHLTNAPAAQDKPPAVVHAPDCVAMLDDESDYEYLDDAGTCTCGATQDKPPAAPPSESFGMRNVQKSFGLTGPRAWRTEDVIQLEKACQIVENEEAAQDKPPRPENEFPTGFPLHEVPSNYAAVSVEALRALVKRIRNDELFADEVANELDALLKGK